MFLLIFCQAYPIVFTEGHHLSAGISGLMFLPLLLGGTTSVLAFHKRLTGKI
jgi:hypothetical protein